MSPGGSKQMRDLFAAARADGPDAATRDALWDRLAVTTGAGVAAGVKAGADAGGAAKVSTEMAAGVKVTGVSVGAVKLVVAGAAVGALVTGLAASAVLAVSEPAPVAVSSRSPRLRARAEGRASGAELVAAPARAKLASPPEEAADVEAPRASVARAPSVPARNAESALAEEARLLTEARRALVRGDADAALARIAEAKQLKTRALEPEQMGIEARALRAAGRADEAAAVELGLRARYPEHALAK